MHLVCRQACRSRPPQSSFRSSWSIDHPQSPVCSSVVPGHLQLEHRQAQPRSTPAESETLGPGTPSDPASCSVFDVFPAGSNFGTSTVTASSLSGSPFRKAHVCACAVFQPGSFPRPVAIETAVFPSWFFESQDLQLG